jgi:sugar lactone lactonase YvrE
MPMENAFVSRRACAGIACSICFGPALLLAACGNDSSSNDANAPVGGAGMSATTNTTSGGGGQQSAPAAMGSGGSSAAMMPGNGAANPMSASGTGGHGTQGMHTVSSPQVDAGMAMHAPSDAGAAHTKPALFWLDISGNAVMRAAGDGSGSHAIASGGAIMTPDGVAVDLDADGGHVYWTNMGSPLGGAQNGSLQRARLDGSEVEGIVAVGMINTPKQMTIDHENHKLYFCDREGAKVWRANLDGSELEILASDHDFVQLVGIALDVPKKQFYFTDRMAKKIRRASFEMPAGETAMNRSDIEELVAISGNAMPIDLDVDLGRRQIYWTDRVLGTVQRAGMDLPMGETSSNRSDIETLVHDVTDSIGISLDLEDDVFYFGQLNGSVWRVNRDGSGQKMVASSGSVSGVSLARLPDM